MASTEPHPTDNETQPSFLSACAPPDGLVACCSSTADLQDNYLAARESILGGNSAHSRKTGTAMKGTDPPDDIDGAAVASKTAGVTDSDRDDGIDGEGNPAPVSTKEDECVGADAGDSGDNCGDNALAPGSGGKDASTNESGDGVGDGSKQEGVDSAEKGLGEDTEEIGGDSADDEDALARELDAIDVDTDYNVWSSFRRSLKVAGSLDEAEGTKAANGGDLSNEKAAEEEKREELSNEEREDIKKWAARVHHHEIFSKTYRPVPRETREMEDLANFLGVANSDAGKASSGGKKVGAKLKGLLERSKSNETETKQKAQKPLASNIFFPEDGEPRSVLLKRGPVLLQDSETGQCVERELILVTHAFVIAAVCQESASPPLPNSDTPKNPITTPSKGKKMLRFKSGLKEKLIQRNLESCDALNTIVLIEDLSLVKKGKEDYDNHSFAITVEAKEERGGFRQRLVFTCGKVEQKSAWLEALEVAVVRVHLGMEQDEGERDPGFPHDILRTSLYAAAICDDATLVQRALLPSFPRKVGIDALDPYGRCTALHYTAMENHLNAMEALLKAGANPNVKDSANKAPLYYAELSEYNDGVAMLKANGAVKTLMDGMSELFGAATKFVRATAPAPGKTTTPHGGVPVKHSASKETRAKEAEDKAKGIGGIMSQTMAAMKERGERLEKMDDQTKELQNEAAEYRDLARKLKEKTKKKGVFGL